MTNESLITLKRDPADILKKVLWIIEKAEQGSDEADIFDLAMSAIRQYTGGEIWPFEYEALENMRKATNVAQIKAAWETISDNPHYDWPFASGDRVVNVLETADWMTKGKTYEVINCYDGHSGCGGPQTWVRVVDDAGHISGYDPHRFVLQDTWVALNEARAGSGYLIRHDSDFWSRPHQSNGEIAPEAAHLSDVTVNRLVKDNIFILETDGIACLREGARILKRCGLNLTPTERVERLLRKRLTDIIDGSKPLTDVAAAIVKEFNLDR